MKPPTFHELTQPIFLESTQILFMESTQFPTTWTPLGGHLIPSTWVPLGGHLIPNFHPLRRHLEATSSTPFLGPHKVKTTTYNSPNNFATTFLCGVPPHLPPHLPTWMLHHQGRPLHHPHRCHMYNQLQPILVTTNSSFLLELPNQSSQQLELELVSQTHPLLDEFYGGLGPINSPPSSSL